MGELFLNETLKLVKSFLLDMVRNTGTIAIGKKGARERLNRVIDAPKTILTNTLLQNTLAFGARL